MRIDEFVSEEVSRRLLGALLLTSPDGQILDASQPALDVYGYSRAEILALGLSDLGAPEERDALEAHLRMAAESTAVLRSVSHRKDGAKFPVEIESLHVGGGDARAILTVVRDASELAVAMGQKWDREHSQRLLFESMTEAFAVHEIILDGAGIPCDYRFLQVDPAFERLTGLKTKQVVGHTVLEVMPAIEHTWIDRYGRVALTGEPISFESYSEELDKWYEVSAYALGRGRFATVFRDVTERRAIEQALKASEDKFKYLFEHSIVAKSVTKPNGEINVNNAFCDMLGYTAEEIAEGSTWQGLTHPDDVAETERVVKALLAGELPSARFVKRFIHKDGHTLWADLSTSLRRDSEGNPEYFMTTILDITERKHAEDELRARERELNESQRIAAIGHYTYEIQKDHWSGSPMLHDVLGTIGTEGGDFQGWLAIVHPDDREALAHHFTDEVLGQGRPFDKEYRIIRSRDGVERWVHGLGTVDYDGDGRPLAMFGVIQDITDRKLAENEILRLNTELEERVQDRTKELAATNEELLSTIAELHETNAVLEEATRAKSDFLTSMSHELRTPLNSVIGFSDILGKGLAGELNEEQRKQVGMINNSGRHLLGLVNSILDLAKIESGKLKPTMRDVDVCEVVRKMFETIRPMADEKGIDTRLECATDPIVVHTDDLQVRQIVLNLMSNAIKFTEHGSIAVTISRADGEVAIGVSDSGQGIPPQDLDRVFEEFYQVSPAGGIKAEGTGLGLAVSRRLAEVLGGTIDVASEVGRGSTFTLRLRVQR